MSATLEEAASEGDVLALQPVVLAYAGVISDTLARHHGLTIPPEDILGTMFDDPSAFLPPKGRTFVARGADGAVLGTAFLKPLTPERIELKRLYVRDAARGQGLGRRLLRHAMEAARDMGASEMYLDTLKALTPAIALYKAEGFAVVDPYPEAQILSVTEAAPHATFMKADL